MKKLLLIIALLISALGLNAQDATFGDLVFTVTSETPAECEVSGYSGEPTDVTIPSKVTISGKEYSVTSIGDDAFYYCYSLTSIEIPSGVTSIGSQAFRDCSSLTSIELPSGVTSIESQAFRNCSSLTSIEFEENSQLTSIGDYAFSECSSLTSIEIPSSVTSIGDNPFVSCPSLTSIVVESGNTIYDSRDNCNAIIETATNTLTVGCQNTVIPNTVTSIGDLAFYVCSSLTSIEIPSGVTSIGDGAFNDCSSLTSIELPSGVTSIGVAAFYYCSSLTSVTFGENSQLTSIGNHAFYCCFSLTSIEFGENSQLTSIGEVAFYECSSLTSIEIPSGVTSIGELAFRECSSLTSIEIPSGVTSIGDNAFEYCSSLTSIEIPSGVTSIGERAFSGCSSLTSIIVESGNTVYDSRDNCNAIIETATNTLIVGCQSTIIPSSVTSIGEAAFNVCSSLTSIELPSGVTSIGDDAFEYCSSLTSIEIPSGVTSIGRGAFSHCSSLTSVTFGENSQLASIGGYAFSWCSSLTSIEIPSGVTSIGVGAYECSSLTSIEIPSGVTSIGIDAFSGCSSLTSIEIPSGVTFIGNWAFDECYSLTSIYCYAESVPETGSNAFDDCPSDMVIYVPEQSVGAYKAASPWNEYTILAMPNYEIAAVIAPSESGVVTGAGTYNHGEEVTLTATANEGYKFINWTENGEVVSEEAEYSFEITKDRNLVANFELLTYEVVASVNIENAGEITGAGSYEENDTVTLTAKANEDYKFVNWTENDTVVSTEAEYSFVITRDRNLVANFELLTYEVVASVNIENAGEITGAGSYEENDTVTLTAKANEGYKFVNWTENGEVVSEEAEYSFKITKDRNLVANFEEIEDPENPGGNEPGDGEITCIVTAVANPEEGGSVSGAGTYKKDMTVTLKATAKSGYQFLNWTENDVIVSTESEYTFTITKDINLVANFEKTTCNVIVVVNPEEAGTVTGAGTYVKNMSVTLVATANPGYKFVNWTENGTIVSTEREYSFVVSLDTDLVANFISTEGVEELASSFNIYPNPVSDKLYIETRTQTQTVEIYDVYGRQQSMVNGQQSTVIDVSDLNSGVYFVKVVTSEGEAVKRFIKK